MSEAVNNESERNDYRQQKRKIYDKSHWLSGLDGWKINYVLGWLCTPGNFIYFYTNHDFGAEDKKGGLMRRGIEIGGMSVEEEWLELWVRRHRLFLDGAKGENLRGWRKSQSGTFWGWTDGWFWFGVVIHTHSSSSNPQNGWIILDLASSLFNHPLFSHHTSFFFRFFHQIPHPSSHPANKSPFWSFEEKLRKILWLWGNLYYLIFITIWHSSTLSTGNFLLQVVLRGIKFYLYVTFSSLVNPIPYPQPYHKVSKNTE